MPYGFKDVGATADAAIDEDGDLSHEAGNLSDTRDLSTECLNRMTTLNANIPPRAGGPKHCLSVALHLQMPS